MRFLSVVLQLEATIWTTKPGGLPAVLRWNENLLFRSIWRLRWNGENSAWLGRTDEEGVDTLRLRGEGRERKVGEGWMLVAIWGFLRNMSVFYTRILSFCSPKELGTLKGDVFSALTSTICFAEVICNGSYLILILLIPTISLHERMTGSLS